MNIDTNIEEIISNISRLNSRFTLLDSSLVDEVKEEWREFKEDENLESDVTMLKNAIDKGDENLLLNTLVGVKSSLQEFNAVSESLEALLGQYNKLFVKKFFPEEKLIFDGDIDKYLEGNFNAQYGGFFYELHEESCFNQELFDEMYNLIKSNFDQIKDKIILYKIYSLILKYIVHHQSRNDLFVINNLSIDELSENLRKFDDNIISYIV